MGDIASNLLYNLVLRELGRQGSAVPARVEPAPSTAVRPKGDKSALLAAVYAAHGALPLLRVGQGLRDVGAEPTLDALLRAAGPLELLERWQRLERYVHSQHRVATVSASRAELRAPHVSAPRRPPTPRKTC